MVGICQALVPSVLFMTANVSQFGQADLMQRHQAVYKCIIARDEVLANDLLPDISLGELVRHL